VREAAISHDASAAEHRALSIFGARAPGRECRFAATLARARRVLASANQGIRVHLPSPNIVVVEHTNPEAPGSLSRHRPGLRSPAKPGGARLGYLPPKRRAPPRSAHASPRAAGAVKANPQTATAALASTRHGQRRQRRGLCPRAPGPHHESEPRRRRPHRRPETPRSARRPSTRSAGTARADRVKGRSGGFAERPLT
jgi:hypothetical protein